MKQSPRPLNLTGTEPHIREVAIVDVPPAGGTDALIAVLAALLVTTCNTPTPATLSLPAAMQYVEAA